jgi:hypothetical protein
VTKLPFQLRSIFRRSQADPELLAEMQFHFHGQMDHYIARGMTPENAVPPPVGRGAEWNR